MINIVPVFHNWLSYFICCGLRRSVIPNDVEEGRERQDTVEGFAQGTDAVQSYELLSCPTSETDLHEKEMERRHVRSFGLLSACQVDCEYDEVSAAVTRGECLFAHNIFHWRESDWVLREFSAESRSALIYFYSFWPVCC